jgi:predicted metal-dependent hydrolase
LRSKQYDKAAPLLLECQNVAEKYKLTRTEVYIFNTYLQGVIDIDFKKYDAAIKNFNKEITAAKFINSIIFMDDGYRHLSDAYVAKKDFKNGFENKSI